MDLAFGRCFLVPKSSDSKLPAGLLVLPRTRITYERHQELSLTLLHILWRFSTFEFEMSAWQHDTWSRLQAGVAWQH